MRVRTSTPRPVKSHPGGAPADGAEAWLVQRIAIVQQPVGQLDGEARQVPRVGLGPANGPYSDSLFAR